MRSGPELILATKRFAQDRPLTSWWHILSTGLLLVLAIVGTIWNVHWTARLACSLLGAMLWLRFFVIYHDQQHHAILPHSGWAERLMRIFGMLALSASSVWRSSHNHHHNHNSKLRGSHIGSFPIMTRAQFEKSTWGEQTRYLAIRHPLTILAGYPLMFAYGMCIQPFLNDPRKHYDCLLALVIHLGLGAALLVFGSWHHLLLTQTLPFVLAYALGCYLFYAQHNFPGVSFHDRAGWTYEKAALESSSFLKTNWLMTWFTANIGHHHIHHLNAKIPFYRLPEVMGEMPELQQAITTSLHPRDILRCLRLKVWDVELQRMVGLRKAPPVRPTMIRQPENTSAAVSA